MNCSEVWLKASENYRNGSKNVLHVGRNISRLSESRIGSLLSCDCVRGWKVTPAGKVFTYPSMNEYQVIWELSGKSP